MKQAMVLVCPQNDYLHPKGKQYVNFDTDAILDKLASFIGGFNGIIFLALDEQDVGCEYCVHDSWGAAIVDICQAALRSTNAQIIRFHKQGFTSRSLNNKLTAECVISKSIMNFVGYGTHSHITDIVAGMYSECVNEHDILPKIIVHKQMTIDNANIDAKVYLDRMHTLYNAKIV